jgi:hypothetical protein
MTEIVPPQPAKTKLEEFTVEEIEGAYNALEQFKVKGQKFKYLLPIAMKKQIDKDAELKLFVGTLIASGEAAWGRPKTRSERRSTNGKAKKLW